MYFACMIRVLFVCLGNICRSPLAEGVFVELLKERGLAHLFEVDSAGTASYHIGNLADARSRKVALEQGFELTHRARAFTSNDFSAFDYIVVMDKNNEYDVNKKRPTGNTTPVVLMRGYDTKPGTEVPDPYYGDYSDFEEVYEILKRCCVRFLDEVVAKNAI